VTRSGVQVTILHLTLGLLGCGAWSGDPPVELAAATRDSAGVRILELSHTLNAVAAGASNAMVFDSQGRRVATLGRPGMGPVSFGSRGP